MKRKGSKKSAGGNQHQRDGGRAPGVAGSGVASRRVWVYRAVLAILVPPVLLVSLELGLRLAGFGHSTEFLLRSTIEGQAMLIQNDRVTWPFFGRDLARQPFPVAIPARKARDTLRIFVFGESAAYGDPQPEFGLPRMLEALLSGRYPGVRFEVVNAAMTGINSHAILRIARGCAAQGGDVWVIYMGNNEVVGPFGAGTTFGPRAPSPFLVKASLGVKATRTGQLLEGLRQRITTKPREQREWGGMGMFLKNQVRQDAPEMAAVYAHFRRNLEHMIEAGQRGGSRIVAGTVASNLKDCAPFGSLHRGGLGAGELDEWSKIYGRALEAYKRRRFPEAVTLLNKASQADNTFAELHYLWGRCCLELGQRADAARHLALARDLDVLRFRADSTINGIIREMVSKAGGESVRLAEAEGALAQQSPEGILGNELLYEHVHLTFKGNYLLARTFAEGIVEVLPRLSRLSAPDAGWPSLEASAKRLGWTGYDRRKAQLAMLARISEPPYTAQLDHDLRLRMVQQELEALRGAAGPAGLGEAAVAYEHALAGAPDDWVLLKGLASVQQETGEFAKAVQSLRRILQRLPHYTEGWQELGRSLLAAKQNSEATAAFQRALKLEPHSVLSWMGLAHSLNESGRTKEAIAGYEQALRIKPYWSPAHFELGKALRSCGQATAAQSHFKQALESRLLTPPALRALGSFCFEQGWLNEACTNFADAVRLEPTDVTTRVNLGITLSSLGRRADAAAQFAEALRLEPTSAEAHVRLGLELGRQGKDAEALQHFAEALRLDPSRVEARLNLAVALLNQQRNDEALRHFQEVLREHPTNSTALNYVRRMTSSVPKPPGGY